MVKVIGNKKDIEGFLFAFQCPEENQNIKLDECPVPEKTNISCLECCAKEYGLEIEYTD